MIPGNGATPEVRAILAADIVGSTALRATLGDERADRLLRAFTEMSNHCIAQAGGVIRRWMGDGLTAALPSASAAIDAALTLQRSINTYSRRADAIIAFQVRIGIGVGEVVYDADDDEEHGIAVIEAARLERVAAPGEVIATELVQLLGQRRSNARFESLGTVLMKGFDEPVAIVRVIDPEPYGHPLAIPGSLAIDRRFPLVGRSDAMATGLTCWESVVQGEACTLLISGQPGIGKTRFAAQIAERAHEAHALVLAGVCDADLAVPYQPVARALADVQDMHPDLAAAIQSGEGPLGAMFPARRTGRDDGGTADRLDLFESVVAVVEQLAMAQPVVLVLDDIQWATAPTVQMIRHMMRRLHHCRVLLIATYRADGISLGHPLNDVLVEAQASRRATTIELGQLGFHDVVELISARLGFTPTDPTLPFAARVLEESAGNSFFVCELLDHLASTNQLAGVVESGGDQLPIPDSVRGIVGQRLGHLPADVTDLLVTAAVIGHTFDVDLVANLLARRADQVLSLVEAAAGVALVMEVDVGVFAFAHAMVRTTILDGMSATRRAMNHRRVAEALNDLRPAAHDHLALHWQLAGVHDRATTHLELAARRDLEAFAFESAADRFQQLLDYHGPVETVEVARAWLGLGLAHRALGRPDYLAAMITAGRLARRLHDPEVLADAAVGSIWPGTYLRPGEALPGVIELAEHALAVIGPSDSRRPRVLATIGVHDIDPERRTALIGEAIRIAEATGNSALIGHVLVAEHIANWNPSTLDQRAEIIERLTRVARDAGVPELEYYAGLFVVFNHAERGDIAGARRALRDLEPSTRASRGVYLEFMAERFTVALDLFTGAPDAQTRIDALATRFAATHADTVNTWAGQTALLANYQGRMGAMAPAIRSALDRTNLGETWRPSLGLALALDGQRDEAAEILANFDEPAFDYFWMVTMLAAGDLAAELGDASVARRLFERLLPFRNQLCIAGPGSLCYGFVATTLGRLALTFESYAEAVDLLRGAIERADSAGAPYDSVRARRVLAQTLCKSGGDRSSIAAVVDQAIGRAAQYSFAHEHQLLSNLAHVSLDH